MESSKPPAKKLSWQWKIVMGVLSFIAVVAIFIFTPFGQDWMVNRLNIAFENTPISERRDSKLAQQWLSLARWKGSFLQDKQGAIEMYREFLGLGPSSTPPEQSFVVTGKLIGPKVSPDGKIGWGPLHPDAPDAYWSYMELLEYSASSSKIDKEAGNYYRLFYDWMLANGYKVHPKFNRWWLGPNRLEERIRSRNNKDIDRRAPEAPPWRESTAK